MIARLTFLLLLLSASVAHANEFDHLMSFPDEATAQADPVVGQYWTPPSADNPSGSWRGDVAIPGVVAVQTDSGTALTGWRIIIALPNLSAALEADPACEIIFDDDAAIAGQPFILYSVYVASDLADLTIQPMFAGRMTAQLMAASPIFQATSQAQVSPSNVVVNVHVTPKPLSLSPDTSDWQAMAVAPNAVVIGSIQLPLGP